MANTLSLAEPTAVDALAQLPYFVDWRPRLWAPAVRWLIGDPARFQGKKVLDVGCRFGRMSCLFGLLGARVVGVDLPGVSQEPARQEAARWGVEDRVQFLSYSGDPGTLPEGDFDFVFTKSVLVMIPALEAFFTALAPIMKPGGELIAAENLAGGRVLNFLRRAIVHRRHRTNFLERFHGVDNAFLDTLGRSFEIVDQKRFCWLVTALRARVR